MPGALSPLERLIITTARKYLVGTAKTWEEVSEPIKLPFTVEDALIAEANPWCEHWLYGKISNDCRTAKTKPPDLLPFQKALLSLIKKKYLKKDWSDRYNLIVEATRFVR